MERLFFDDALPKLVDILLNSADKSFVEEGVILRDASGRLSFFARREPTTESEREILEKALLEGLGAYARGDSPISFAEDIGAQPLLNEREWLRIKVNNVECHLLDRRIVGAGWLDEPKPLALYPPRIAFASLKGGVGRSTALAVAAMDLARRNQNVLVVDLDLEAPGLGSLLLSDERLPEFGVIDFLVENGLAVVEDARLDAFVGSSELTMASAGRIDVLPALGERSRCSPANVLPKLARAMIEDVTDAGVVSVTEQISGMLSRIAARAEYDVILIDSRAGLSELAAPVVIGLGASVLLFGTAQQQTVDGYGALLAALGLLAQRDNVQRSADWRMALRPVYAKASMEPGIGERFREGMYELYSEHLYDAEQPGELNEDILRFSQDDDTAPHWPLIIPFSQEFIDFEPKRLPSQLTQSFYERVYRGFLDGLDEIIGAGKVDGQIT
jgi:MinD-like ATPase involved in chromosome partitioning or flagellar assembly